MAEHTYGLFENDINKRLIEKLRAQNASLLLLPEPIAGGLMPPRPLELAKFDWIVFPDLHSVDHFLGIVREKFELDELSICALGEAISDRLRFSQVHADVIPPGINVEAAFAAIVEYQPPAGLRFLIPSAAGAKTELSAVLEGSGAIVEMLPVYKIADVPEFLRLRTLLASGAVDEFVFTSPQDVFSLSHFLDLESAGITFSATDEITFQTLREFGSQPVVYK